MAIIPTQGGGGNFSQKWKNKEEFIVKKRGNGNRREKRGGKTEVKRGIGVKKRNYSYLVSLFNIGPYGRQKKVPKTKF